MKDAKTVRAEFDERMDRGPKKQPEFALPDESRRFSVSLKRCPECSWQYPELDTRWMSPAERKEYRVVCWNASCLHKTPWFSSSQQAIQHWQLVAVLSQP